MMKFLLSRCREMAIIGAWLVLAGCLANTAPTRFYMIEPAAPALSVPALPEESQRFRLVLDPVEIPEYVNRPQIVTHLDRTEYDLDEFHQWLEPLDDNLTRVMAENLAALLAADGIDVLAMTRPAGTDIRVTLQVLRLDGKRTEKVVLVARWSIFDTESGDMLATRRTVLQEVAEEDGYRGLVGAKNRLVETLSQEMAAGIRRALAERTRQ